MREPTWKTYPSGWPQFPILETIEKQDYANYRHMMFTLPIALRAKCIVETGLGNGHSTKIFLESLKQMCGHSELHTFELEPDKNVVEDIMKIVTKTHPWDLPHWYLHVGRSIDLPNTTEGASITKTGFNWEESRPIGFLFLDSLHTYEYLSSELEAFKPYLSDKAWIMIDDVWHADSGDENKGEYYTRNPGSNPSDLYYAAKDWSSKNNWKYMTFTETRGFGKEDIKTSGKMLLYREYL